jgi:uncharacterized protein
MKRLIDYYLREWSTDSYRKPLLLRGARQVGKTYAVKKLGKKFENFIELDLEQNIQIRNLFSGDLFPEKILEQISFFTGKKIIPGKTLLFLDEVQAEPRAVLALRYFYEFIPELHVIAAGSLLDFAIEQVGVPVGRVEFLHMYPVSFIEFLAAKNSKILMQELLVHDAGSLISEIAHTKLLELLAEYFAIGGMPEVVQRWIDSRYIEECFKIQQSIANTYKRDFAKYAKKTQIKYLDALFNSIPLQLGKKFKYSSIEGDFRKRELSPCLDLLDLAGVVHKVYHTDAHGIPLGAQADLEIFKLIFLDIALAQSLMGFNLKDWFLYPYEQFVNKGEISESFVGQELLAYSEPTTDEQLYFWMRTDRTAQAEIDYVKNILNNIVPIEVKSGVGTTLKSMHIFLDKHPKSKYGVRFSTQNYSVYKNIYSYPLYAIIKPIYDSNTNLQNAVNALF